MANGDTLTLWVGGTLFGLGCGLMIARSIPATDQPTQSQAVMSKAASIEPTGHLSNPAEVPSPRSLERSGFQTQNLGQKIEPPRLLPPGNALPVPAAQPLPTQPEYSSTSTPDFRKELEATSQDLPEEALDELTKIRDLIEGGEE